MKALRPLTPLLAEALRDFGRSFAPLVGYEVLYRIVAFALIAPASAWILRSLVGMTGRYALGNTELIRFAFSPIGLAIVLVSGVLAVFGIFLQHAGAIIIADARHRGRRLTAFGTFWRVVLNVPRMIHLGVEQIVRYALVVLPGVALIGLAYWLLWSEADLYYLTNARPPRFWAGVVLAGVIVAVGAVLVGRMYLRWVVALPLVLLEGRPPREALRESRKRTSGQMLRNLGVLAACTLGVAALGAIAAGAFALISTGVLGQLPGTLRVTIPALAALLGLQFLLIEAVEITGSILVGLVVYRIAHEHGLAESSKRVHLAEEGILLRKVSLRRQLARKVAFVVLALVVMAGLFSLGLLATIGVSPSVTVTAHRGAKHDAPENTLAAIRAAIAAGADAAEIDVQLSADGVVVVFHDDDLNRLAGDPRRLTAMTFEELRAFDVGSWFGPEFEGERIPTLDEVLDEAGDRLALNIELKMSRPSQDPAPLVRGVLDALDRKQARDRCILSTLSSKALAEVRRQAPDVRVGFIVFEAVGDPTRLDLDFLSVRDTLATDDFIARARRRGRPVHVWTVDDPDRFVTFVQRGVDDVLTGEPALMVARRAELAELNDLERLLLWYRRLISDR